MCWWERETDSYNARDSLGERQLKERRLQRRREGGTSWNVVMSSTESYTKTRRLSWLSAYLAYSWCGAAVYILLWVPQQTPILAPLSVCSFLLSCSLFLGFHVCTPNWFTRHHPGSPSSLSWDKLPFPQSVYVCVCVWSHCLPPCCDLRRWTDPIQCTCEE